MTCKLPNDMAAVSKETYEGRGLARVDVEDWGLVRRDMRQPLHAFLYAWLARVCRAKVGAEKQNEKEKEQRDEWYVINSWCRKVVLLVPRISK